MAWAVPEYSRETVDEAGNVYADRKRTPQERDRAVEVINNWRSSHSFPLNTLQMNLRDGAGRFDADRTVARRIKRLPSIRQKLERFGWLTLSEMQDVGGARAVVSDVTTVNQVVDFYLTKRTRMKHRRVRHDPYIDRPKRSGYRGVHLVYEYFSDKNNQYNGLRIELQIRSRLQHAWATAVETVGIFTEQALKSSSGDPDWLRFFALMSSQLAFRERTPIVPGTPHDHDELTHEVRRYAHKLKVVDTLTAYRATVQLVGDTLGGGRQSVTFLLELDAEAQQVRVRPFVDELEAVEYYSEIERQLEGAPGRDVVLVAGESLASLRRAYPNYFADTRLFLDAVQEAIE